MLIDYLTRSNLVSCLRLKFGGYLVLQGYFFSISPTVGGCELGGLRSSSPSQGQVHQGAAEVDLDLDSGDLSSGWAPRATSAQVPLVKSKFTSAAPW